MKRETEDGGCTHNNHLSTHHHPDGSCLLSEGMDVSGVGVNAIHVSAMAVEGEAWSSNSVPALSVTAPLVDGITSGGDTEETILSNSELSARSSNLGPWLGSRIVPSVDVAGVGVGTEDVVRTNNDISNGSADLLPVAVKVSIDGIPVGRNSYKDVLVGAKLVARAANLMPVVAVKLVNIVTVVYGPTTTRG